VKAAVVYHTVTANTEKVAGLLIEGMVSVPGVEAKAMRIEEIDEAYIKEARLVVFGCPTYAATCSWQMQQFIQTTKVKFGGKLGGVFATENYVGGGADVAELALIGMLLVRGLLIYAAGAFEGQPFTHMGAVAIKDGDEYQKDRAKIFGKRMAAKAVELFST
jgi:NAD(P)H dehydrogenase (quinone)